MLLFAFTWCRYHLVIGVQRVGTAGLGNWYVWVNGNQLPLADALVPGSFFTNIQGALYPIPAARPKSYLGNSDFASDPIYQGWFDAFRVYNYLLDSGTVQRLATAYGCYAAFSFPQSYAFSTTSETTLAMAVPGITKAPVFNAAFGENPAFAVGVNASNLNYQWYPTDPYDPPSQQSFHSGVVRLNGSDSSYVDLGTPYGPNSCGLVMPVIGGAGSGNMSAGTQGTTFELVFKVNQVLSWSKIVDIGTGGNLDSMAISWDGNDFGGEGGGVAGWTIPS